MEYSSSPCPPVNLQPGGTLQDSNNWLLSGPHVDSLIDILTDLQNIKEVAVSDFSLQCIWWRKGMQTFACYVVWNLMASASSMLENKDSVWVSNHGVLCKIIFYWASLHFAQPVPHLPWENAVARVGEEGTWSHRPTSQLFCSGSARCKPGFISLCRKVVRWRVTLTQLELPAVFHTTRAVRKHTAMKFSSDCLVPEFVA